MKNLSAVELKLLKYNAMNVDEAVDVTTFDTININHGANQTIPLNKFASTLYKMIKNKQSNIHRPHDRVELELMINIFTKLFPKEYKTLNDNNYIKK